MNILNSATKIVLLLIILTMCILTFVKIVDAKDFMSVVSVIVAFYFWQKTATTDINDAMVAWIKADAKKQAEMEMQIKNQSSI